MRHQDPTTGDGEFPGRHGLPSLGEFIGKDLGEITVRRPRSRTVHLQAPPLLVQPSMPPPVSYVPGDGERRSEPEGAEATDEERDGVASSERAEAIRARDPIASLAALSVSPDGMVGHAETRRHADGRRGFPLGAVLVAAALSVSIVIATLLAGASGPPSAPAPAAHAPVCTSHC